MGKEIVYCFHCGTRLLSSDFEKGAAFRVGQECACADCMPILLEMMPPEEREAFQRTAGGEKSGSATPRRGTGRVPLAEGARGSTTRRTQPAKAAPGEVPLPPSAPRRRILLLAAAGAGLLAAIGTLLLFLPRKGKMEGSGTVVETPSVPKLPPPRTIEEIASDMLRKAREHAIKNPEDLEGQLRELQEAAWKYEKTAAGTEALREAAALKEKIAKGLTPAMEKLLEKIRGPLEAEEYRKALDLLDKAKEGDAKPAWILQVDRRIDEVKAEAAERFEEVRRKAEEAKGKGEKEELGKLRERVARWGIGTYAEEFERAFGGMEEAAAKKEPAGRTEEGKAYLERWKEAVRPATNRDYAAARRALERAAEGLKEEATRREAEEDLKDLREAEGFYQGAVKAVEGWGVGRAVTVEAAGPGGAREAVEGVVVSKGEGYLEVRKEGRKEGVFVESAELTGASLVRAGLEAGGAARAAAIFLALEGEAEEAKKTGGIPEKYGEYAKEAREKAPRRDEGEWRKEREAKRLYWGAERDFGRMQTLGEAIEKYKALAKDYVGTEIARKHVDRITVRSEAGKDYFLLAGDLRGSGAVGMKAHPELKACWTCREDVTDANAGRETYVEIEFWALPGAAYQCWVYAGACCQETFLTYLQATDMTGPNPRKPSEKISYDVGAAVAAPLDPKVKGLKKTHAQHGGEKQASKWEWIPVPLPKYPAGGLKKVRLLTEHKGFSVGMAVVSSVRKGPPKAEELGEEMRRAEEAAKGRMRADPSLVGHWTLDEGGTDASSAGNHGKVTGKPKKVPGRIGGALEFDGAGDFLEIPHHPAQNPFPLTASAWFRTANAFPSHVGLINKYQAGSNIGWQILLHQGTVRAWYFKDRQNHTYDGQNGIGGGTVNDGAWHHVAFVVDETGARLYLDGASIAQREWTGKPGLTAATDPLSIGRYPGDRALFRGAVDDIRIFNRALGPPEIQELFQIGLGR